MKSKLIFIFLLFLNNKIFAENLLIEAKNITLDKDNVTSVFKDDVVVKTESKTIKSDYVKYNKKSGFLIIKNNILARDKKDNIIESQYAEYFEKEKVFKSVGLTKITTSEKYVIEGEDITFNNKRGVIFSKKKAILKDLEGNKILIKNFEYEIEKNIFKSIGFVKIDDKNGNTYEFSQIYIDTKKNEILGTDIKAFLNQENLKINKNNKPRIFANTIKIAEDSSSFSKSIFTLCDYRENDKCPPWSIQASKMLHDNQKKTIFYDNAIIKVYDIPIFYLPRLSHPDPTVDRRSGFLPPTLYDSKNLGIGVSLPYFFAVSEDKNLTLTSRIFTSENPLFIGEFQQAFKNSEFFADFGYTEGYKKTSDTKKGGNKSHFFSKFVKNFKGKNNSKNILNINIQDVSNDKYLKLYKIDSNLVDYNKDTLETSINFSHENDDFFLGVNASVFETLKDSYNDKFEFIFPEITLDRNFFSDDKIGNLDLLSNLKVHNYDTNKLTSFLVNDLNWNSKEIKFKSGLQGKFLGNLKNINYEAKNVDPYKDDFTSELFGAFGYLTELNLQKDYNNSSHFLTPKLFLRYSPGSMRQELKAGSRLDPLKAFSINRLDNINNFETGMTASIGLDYKVNKGNQDFDFSLAQVISEKENKKMPSKSSMDEKLSDLVGSASLSLNNEISLRYNFAVDQNYEQFNYNEIGTSINLNPINIDFDYLQENKHIGNQEYFKTKVAYEKNNRYLSFEAKRNLITSSAEFYNLSYEYINDCLRAGLVYRREFYTDSELESENSLMFKITLIPFGNISSPSFNK